MNYDVNFLLHMYYCTCMVATYIKALVASSRQLKKKKPARNLHKWKPQHHPKHLEVFSIITSNQSTAISKMGSHAASILVASALLCGVLCSAQNSNCQCYKVGDPAQPTAKCSDGLSLRPIGPRNNYQDHFHPSRRLYGDCLPEVEEKWANHHTSWSLHAWFCMTNIIANSYQCIFYTVPWNASNGGRRVAWVEQSSVS